MDGKVRLFLFAALILVSACPALYPNIFVKLFKNDLAKETKKEIYLSYCIDISIFMLQNLSHFFY
jgi:hypothetical protein